MLLFNEFLSVFVLIFKGRGSQSGGGFFVFVPPATHFSQSVTEVGNPVDPAEDGTALLEPWMIFSQNASRFTRSLSAPGWSWAEFSDKRKIKNFGSFEPFFYRKNTAQYLSCIFILLSSQVLQDSWVLQCFSTSIT